MIRQARTYLVGAMSGATLIAIAVAAFVLLVSAMVFNDWPIAALGKGAKNSAVSKAQPVGTAGPLLVAAGATTSNRGATAAGAEGAGGRRGGSSSGGSDEAPGGTAGLPGDTSEGGAETPGGSGEGGGGGGSGSESGTTSGGSSGGGGSTATSSPSTKVTPTVNETVNQVDETVTGGALEETGVTKTSEEVVNGVAGPESTAGEAVDETVGTVEGVLGK